MKKKKSQSRVKKVSQSKVEEVSKSIDEDVSQSSVEEVRQSRVKEVSKSRVKEVSQSRVKEVSQISEKEVSQSRDKEVKDKEAKRHTCDVCNKVFPFKSTLESHKAVSHGNYAYLKQFVLAEGGFIGCKFCNNSYSFSKVDSVVAHIGRMHMKDVKILEDAMVVGAGVEELTVEVDADDFPLKDEDDQSVVSG